MEILEALSCVDVVHCYHELEYVSECKKVKADIFIVGEDWGNQPHNMTVEAYLKAEGKQIVLAQPNQYSRIAQTAG